MQTPKNAKWKQQHERLVQVVAQLHGLARPDERGRVGRGITDMLGHCLSGTLE